MITNSPSKEVLKKSREVAELIFGTKDDPQQIPIGDSREKLKKLNENCFLYEVDDQDNLISWIVVMPTTEELMQKFLKKEINERELFEKTPIGVEYTALYFCSAITLPEYRGKGYARNLRLEAFSRFNAKDMQLFSWPVTKDGLKSIHGFEKFINKEICLRKD